MCDVAVNSIDTKPYCWTLPVTANNRRLILPSPLSLPPQPVKELPCGHFLHLSCFGDLTRHSYQCPLCKKSVGDMAMYFRMIDAILAQVTCDG